mgnify:FL=1
MLQIILVMIGDHINSMGILVILIAGIFRIIDLAFNNHLSSMALKTETIAL